MSGTPIAPHGREIGFFATLGVPLSLVFGIGALLGVLVLYLLWLLYITTMARLSFRAPSKRKLPIEDAFWQAVDVSTRLGEIRFYRSPTRPNADTAILVHGWSSGATRMTGRAKAFTDAGLNTILVDLPSHGASASLRFWSAEGSVSMLIEGLNRLNQQSADHFGKRLFYFGHSMGGFVGLRLSKRRGELDLDGVWSGWVMESPMTGYSEIFDETCRLLRLPQLFRWSLETRVLRKLCALNPHSDVRCLGDADMPVWGTLTEPTLLLQAANDERLGNTHHERLVGEMKRSTSVPFEAHMLDTLTHSGAHDHAERHALVASWLTAQTS